MQTVNICDCGHPPSKHASFTTGYGIDADGKTACYECCAEKDRAAMVRDGMAVLYLTDSEITNWPGSLRFKVTCRKTGRHNLARRRYDAWFTGPDGMPWHGVTYGDMTQLCHCRRVKA